MTVFDTDYREIPGSAPPRYNTGLAEFADRHLRPIIDRVAASDPRVESSVCSDINGRRWGNFEIAYHDA